MININILSKNWGGCDLAVDFRKIDLLPRFTISEITGCFVLNIGFMMLTFSLCVLSNEVREFQKKLESGESEKEMREQAEKLAKIVLDKKKQKDDTL